MRIEKGYIYAIIGNNGCGKTTLMNQLFLKNHNKELTYIKQNDYLIDQFNIEENLKLMNYDCQNQEINKLLKLDKIRKLYPSQVSLGQRQMIAIICALYNQNEWIIFDETFSGINKNHLSFLLDLCQKFVDNHHKTILIVTHQKDIIDHCDKMIDFYNGVPQIEPIEINDKQRSHVPIKKLLTYQKRSCFKHLIILTILAACFLFVSLTAYYRNMIYDSINEKISKNMSTETFIMNNTDIYHPYYQQYDIYYSSVTTEQLNKLKNIKGLENFQPYIHFSIESQRTNTHEIYYDPIYFITDGQKEKKTLAVDNGYTIEPYTSYSKIKESIQYQTSHDDGIILTKWFCEQMNIDYNYLDNMQIQMSVSIPIAQTETKDGMQTSIIGEDGQAEEYKNIKGREIEYKEIEMTFDIKGVLDQDGPFVTREWAFALLPQESMQSLFEQYNQNYVPNAYFAKIQDIGQYENIQQQVERISPTLEFYCAYSLYQVSDTMFNFINMLSMIVFIPLCLFLIITVYTIFMQRKSRLYEYEKLLAYSFHIKTCFEWIIKKYLLDMALFLFIYLILFQICYLFLNYNHYPLIEIELYTFIFPILFICVIPLGVDIYALHKKYKCSLE